ncbi:MAG: DUF1330 domain-containing protein [Gammaproteobacteria bacterium]|nr:DUF1330 domain-containing protein [Gammaproteobacteria bacterium]
MAKGYWIGHVDISDLDGYKKYQEANAKPFAKYGAKFLVRGGESEIVEGEFRSRSVIIEFGSYEDAVNCYHSEDYQSAKLLRENAGKANIIIVEGYGGPQPA